MDSISLKAYAKINLYLDVTGKRHDGYHLLETVMHTISLHDVVTIKKNSTGDIVIKCTEPSVPCDEKNIAYKCAEAFFQRAGISDRGITVDIEKNIPSQAGMGGGSSDGAAVLRGLNQMYGEVFSETELCETGAVLGADIPFCIVGGCAYCTGIGEIIEPLDRLHGTVLIGKGMSGISTAEAFSRIDSQDRHLCKKNVKMRFTDACCFSDISDLCLNIFDEVTLCEDVAYIKRMMNENGAVCSCMTGSGSAVFGLYDDVRKAEDTEMLLRQAGCFAAVCELL